MLRTFFKSDLNQVLAIEQAVHVSPWTIETFKACFDAGYVGWTIEIEKKIIGFIIVSQHPDECHVLNLCVARPYQQKGYGKTLLLHALKEAKKLGVSIVYLEVRRSNTRAITLYEKMNFYPIGERKDYYPTPAGHEDALIFARSLIENVP